MRSTLPAGVLAAADDLAVGQGVAERPLAHRLLDALASAQSL
jgi:hypothetical protein